MYLLSVNDPKADNESFDAIVNVYNKLNELVATTGWTELARTNAEWSGSLPIDVRRWGCTYHYWADETMTRYPFHTYDQKDANGEYLVKDGGTVYVTYDYDESLYSSENEYRWVNLFFNWDDDHKEWTNDVVHDKEYTAEYWEYNNQTNKFEKRHEYDVMQDYNRWVQHDLYTDTQEGWIESPLESANNYDKNKAYAYNDEGQYADATDAKKQKWAMIGDPYKFILYNYNRKAEAGAKNSYYLRWDDKGNPIAGIQPGIGNYNYSAFPLGKENTPGLYWTWKVDGTRFTFAEGDAQNNTTTYGPRAGLPESFYQDYEGAEASNDAAVKKAGYSIETGYLANCALQCTSLYDKNNLVGTVNGYVTYTHKSLRTTELTNGTGDEAPLTYHTGTKEKFHQYTKDPNNTNPNVNDHNIDYTNNSTVVIPGTHQDEQHPDVEETDDVTFTQQWRNEYGGDGYDNDGKYTSGTYEGYYVGPESSLSRDRYQEFTTYKNVQEYNITGDINSSTQYLTMKIEPSIEKIKADYEAGKANSVHIPRFLVMPMAAHAHSVTFHLQTDKYSDGSNTESLRSADNVILDHTTTKYGVGNTLTLPWMMRREYCDYKFYLVAANDEDDNSNNLAAQIDANKIDDLTHVEGSASNTHRLTSQQRAAQTYTGFWTSSTDLSQDANCYNSTQNEYVVPDEWADKDVFILVKYKPTAEFESMRSTGSGDAKWLNIMNVENGNLMQYTRSNNVTGAGKDTLNNVTNDYLWAIEGDPYGFKLRNRYAVHGFDGASNGNWDTSLMTTGKVNTTENYNYLDGLDEQGSPKNLNFTYNTDGDPVIKSGITYGAKADADAAGIMSTTATNAVYEAMTGNYGGAMLIHPVNACINIRNQNGYKYYGAFMFNGAPTGDPVQLNYMQDWEVMRNVYANWMLKKPAAKQFLSYYQNAGYVGGLKPEVAENETYSAIFDKIAAGTALTTEEYNTAWSLVYNPENLVPFENGYYRLRAYSAGNGVVGGQYASGYLHKNELSSSTGTPLHLYEKQGVTTNYTTLENYDGNDWMANYVGKSSLEVLSPENDPASIFYVSRDNDGYIKIQTQGLVLSGSELVEETGEPTDTLFFEVQDIGQTAFQMRSKTRAIAGTETTYLSCNPNTYKYGLNAASPELNVSEGVSDGQTVKTFDTMWMLQKVGTGTGEMPLNLKLNNGRDGYYYSTFCAPYDVVMPEGVKAFILADAPVANDGSGTTGTAEVVLLSNYTKDKYKENFPEAYRELDNYIPANTPVILRTEETESLTNGAARITIPAIEPSTTAISENMLSASLMSEKLTNIGENQRVYVFGMVGNRVGFGANSSKNPETDAKDNSFTNHHKVYIIYDKTLPNGNSASGFTFLFNEDEFETGGGSQETDGVTQVETDDNNSVIDLEKEPVYDLQGRRVYPPFRRGIYIVRGKKFVIK